MKVLVTLLFDPLLGQTPEQIAEPAMRLLVSPEFEGMTGLLFTQIKRFKAVGTEGEPAPAAAASLSATVP